jgi:hypothetical protein
MALASAFEDLSENDQKKVNSGQQINIYIYRQNPKVSWPEGTIYQRIEETPEQAMAVYFDIAHHHEFLPYVIKSEISNFIERSTFQADYALGVLYLPFGIAQENYSLEYHLEHNVSELSYLLSWHMTRSGNVTEYSQGSIQFEPLENGGTLMVYNSFVLPFSKFYWLASQSWGIQASKKVLKEVFDHTVNQIKKVRTLESERLIELIQELRKSVPHSVSQID